MDAYPYVGKFLAKLGTAGAPGTLVKEVFKTQKELTAFWNGAQ